MGSEGNEFPMEGGEPSGAAEKAVYKKEKISVWWDVERFDVPQWCEPYTICENIRLALRKIRCIGSIKIYAYGDFIRMDKDFKLALKNTGLVLNQVSSGVEDTSDKIIVDMLCWAVDNPAPANYLLISDDPKLSYALHQLRMRSYNIFLAQSQCVSATLAAAAKSVWVWTSILVGGPPLSDYQSSQFGISVRSKEAEYERSFNEPNAFRALTVLCQSQGQCSGSSSKSELPNGSSGKPSQPQMQQLMCAPHEFFVTNETGMMSMATHYESFSANKPEISLPNATGAPYSLDGVSGPEYPINFRDRHTFQQRIGLEGISDFTIHSETPHLQIVKGTNPISSNDIWENPECAEPYDYVQALIGVVLLALDTLKRDKMMPNEANITDCIQYGDPIHRGTDVRKALDYAIKEGMIVKQSVGTLQLYVGKNARIWNCVDPLVGDPEKYSEEIWNRIKRYLTSAGGRSAIMASKCRYEAAITLKNACLQYLVLGDILQLLNMVITTKKWIKAHPSGWRPINIILSE